MKHRWPDDRLMQWREFNVAEYVSTERIWWCELEGLGWTTDFSSPHCEPRLPEESSFHDQCGWRRLV